jgi:protein-L-isoaspartate(D-aspartate) O-methyltransferase
MRETKKQHLFQQVKTYLKHTSAEISEDEIGRIIEAMDVIDRRHFVSEEYAYLDTALPIASGQTISQPSTAARMLVALDLNRGDNVLEIGSGSGWNASLIGYLVYPGNVTSIEQDRTLIKTARTNLKQCKEKLSESQAKKLETVVFKQDNLFTLPKQTEHYTRIICTAGYTEDQYHRIHELCGHLLENGGKAIFPRVSGPLSIFTKKTDGIHESETSEQYIFVPLQDT